jgi:protein-tyrosine-phosphatase
VAGRHILFVCTGNTGRSVASEALARHMIAERGLAVSVASRGVAVDATNRSAEPHVATLLAARGIDVAAHRARQLTAVDINEADRVLTMTATHKHWVLSQFPDSATKVWMLSEVASATREDVPDPVGAPLAVCASMLARLEVLIAAALTRYA